MSYLIITACTGCTACAKICPVTAIRGERKSLHVVDPLICIDCGACGKICPSHAVLDENGELSQSVKRALWKKPLIQEERCVSCGLCLQACPVGVLDYADLVDHQVREIARLKDPSGCIACSFCEMICPVDAISMTA